MADIFISYSRRDKDFVQILHRALLQSHYDTWVDWQDIAPTAEWWNEIKSGIEAAHTCIFVISPDSVASKYCIAEVEHAALHHKRIIPIVRHDFPRGDLPEELTQLQWLYFREHDAFDPAFESLIEAINTDLEHKKLHTRLEVKAIEWRQEREDTSLLLRGSDLERAEQWLLKASGSKEPRPTELQGDYIFASRKSSTQQQRLLLGGLSSLLLVMAGLAGFAFIQFRDQKRQAINSDILAQSLAAESLLTSNRELDALIASVTLGEQIEENQRRLNEAIRMRAIATLRQVVYGVRERNRLHDHSNSVLSISFSPDGQTIASASDDQRSNSGTTRATS